MGSHTSHLRRATVALGLLCAGMTVTAGIGSAAPLTSPPEPFVSGSSYTNQAAALNAATAISGHVLTTNGVPLAGIAVIDGEARTQTDAAGNFTLSGVRAGPTVLMLDGRQGRPSGGRAADYGYYEMQVDAVSGQTRPLGYTSYLPKIDHSHDVTIPVPTTREVVVRTPAIPGLELHIPAGVVLTDPDGKPVRRVGITRIPLDHTPFPLPKNVYVPVYFTAQPGGATISSVKGVWTGAQIWYPNYRHELAGARASFWRYDPDRLGWSVYGGGRVSADRQHVVPDRLTRIYDLTAAMVNSGQTPPQAAPVPDPNAPKAAEPVDLGTGLFVYRHSDLEVSDALPLQLVRTYQSGDFNIRDFGVGMTLNYNMFLYSSNEYQVASAVMPDGSQVQYVNTNSQGSQTSYNSAIFNASVNPGPFFNSTMVWNGEGWTLTRSDGMVYTFGNEEPLQSIQDRFGNQINIARNFNLSNDPVIQVSSPNGRTITFTRGGDLHCATCISQATDNLGRTVTYSYDSSSRLQTVTDADSNVWTYNWDGSNHLTSVTDPLGHTAATNTYDSNNRVLTQTLADGGVYQFSYALNSNGSVSQTNVTDPLDHVRKVTFNADDYPLTDDRATGTSAEEDFTYVRNGATNYPTSITDSLGRVTNWTYDSFGNILTQTLLANTSNPVTTTFTYGAFEQPTSVKDPLGNITHFTLNALGQATTITDPLGFASTLQYNSEGQVTSVTDPLSNTASLSYNNGDIVAVTDPLNRTATLTTDSVGRPLAVTDPLGDQTSIAYDPIHGPSSITEPDGYVSTSTYDADGDPLTFSDPLAHTTSASFDSSERLTRRTDPLGHADRVAAYDKNSNILQTISRLGEVANYGYDPEDRIASASYADGSTTSYAWDLGNRLTSLTDSLGGSTVRTYNGLDDVLSEVTPQGTVTYTYDADQRRATMSVPGQSQVVYTYDNDSRLTNITQGSNTVVITYDNDGRRSTVTLPDGVVASYSYDAASQLTQISYNYGATNLGTLTYAYDLAGRIISRGGTGSLFQSIMPAAVTSASYNADNQMTAFGGVSPTYDLNGSLLNDGTYTYSWDTRKRLKSVSGVASFVYDGVNRRQSATLSGTTTAYLYDGLNPVQEQQGGSVLANLLTGLGIDERFTRTVSGTSSTFLTDNLGSTTAIANASGAVATNYGYAAYGTTTVTGTANSSSYQYTGRENDAVGPGLYYYRGRYYNPVWGRFVSEDPTGFGGGDYNLYRYAGGDTISERDPLGLNTGQVGLGFGGNFGGLFGVNVVGGFGIAWDDSGDIDFYYDGGAGPYVGTPGAYGGVQYSGTNLCDVKQLKGPFGYGSVTAIDAGGGSGEVVLDENGHIIGGGGTIGGGFDNGAAVGVTDTGLVRIHVGHS